MPGDGALHLHLISGSTGETLHALARGALALFREESAVQVHPSTFVRSERALDHALEGVRDAPGPAWFTLIDPTARDRIIALCSKLGAPHAGVLDPLIFTLADALGHAPGHRPGRQYDMNTEYFNRVAALDYAITHDDGALDDGGAYGGRLRDRLRRADVIVAGISRTSKTPTCIYLAYRGVKAANVPLLPNRAPPAALLDAMAARVPAVGLTANPARLAHVRAYRLQSIGQAGPGWSADYVDLDRIRAEVADARLFFQRHGMPVIDVTRRSIEETAAEILAVLRARGQRGGAGARADGTP